MKQLSFIFLSALFILTGCANKQAPSKIHPKYTIENKQDKSILSLKQGKLINIEKLVQESENYPVIFVGDHHDTAKTHEFFKNYLEALKNKGYKLHMMNEWFYPEHNSLLKEFTDGKITQEQLKEKRQWKKFTRFKWELVEPLYTIVKESKGGLYGANISKKDRKKISLKNTKEMDKELKNFYENLDLDVSSHKSLIMPLFKDCAKHGMGSKSGEPCDSRMYRVQVTWDTYMAEQSAKIAKKVLKTNKDKLIVFAGAYHINYGLGIPLRFSRLSNLPSYIITNKSYTNKTKKLEIDQQKANAVFIYKMAK